MDTWKHTKTRFKFAPMEKFVNLTKKRARGLIAEQNIKNLLKYYYYRHIVSYGRFVCQKVTCQDVESTIAKLKKKKTQIQLCVNRLGFELRRAEHEPFKEYCLFH